MKLLAVSTWCPTPPVNGSKLRAFHLLRQLSERHSVRLLTFAGEGDNPHSEELASFCESVEAIRWAPFLKAPPRLRGLLSSWPRSLVQTYSDEMAHRVRIRTGDCDAAVAFEIPAGLYLNSARLPAIMEEVELGGLCDALSAATSVPQRLRGRLTWWKSARFVRRLVGGAAWTTVASDVERAHLTRIGADPARVTVVPNGVSGTDLGLYERPEPSVLIYPGAITYSANLDAVQWLLIDILPRIRREHPDATLIVTGDVDAAAVAALPAVRGVTLTGRLPDVCQRVARSRVCVVPLRRGGGTRLKILQAMAVGTPVVSTTKGAEGLAVRDGVDILIADAPERFAACTVRLIEDDALRERLTERARSMVRREYTWERSGAILNDVLERATARPRVGL